MLELSNPKLKAVMMLPILLSRNDENWSVSHKDVSNAWTLLKLVNLLENLSQQLDVDLKS